jgi:hypothetical protein
MASATTDRRLGLTGDKGMKAPVDCATTANITLSGEQTIDGVTTSTSRVLVKNQTTTTQNGIYDTSSAAWTRALDADGYQDLVNGTMVLVAGGTTQVGQVYQVSGTNPITIGASAIAFSLSLTYNAATVAYTPAGTGAVATTAQAKLRERVSVFDFMTAGEIADVQSGAMTINVSAKILTAHTAAKHVFYPPGTYWMGNQSTSAIMVDFYGLGDNITMELGPGVEFVCNTTASVIPKFFRLSLNNNFRVIGTAKFRDLGYDYTINWRGAGGFGLEGASSSWGNINIDAIRGEGLVYPLYVYGGSTSNRVRGINVGYLDSYNCYYGFNCQNNGDEVTIGCIHSYLNYRPYFVYGCHSHNVTIYNRNNRGTSGAINICRISTGVHTKNLKIKYTAREMAVATTHVLINHIDLTGGTIQNIELDVDIDGDAASPAGYNPIRFVNYDGAAAETAAASSNYVTDIRLKGVCSSGANNVTSVATYVEAGEMAFARGRWFDFDSTITDNFRFATPASGANVKTWTPTWTGSVSNPAIGNGILTGEYEIDDSGICHYSMYIQMGTTTTYGSGTWTFGLPFKSRRSNYGQLHTAMVRDASAGFYVCAALVLSGTPGKLNVYYNGGSNIIGDALPMAWAATDYIAVSGSYAL